MTCDETLERMLEAAPAELRGEVETELARHIAGCERCRAVAAAMIEETGAVDDALAGYAARPTLTDRERAADADIAGPYGAADAATDAVLATIRAASEVASVDRRRTSNARWLKAAWVPLAAAAALAAVLVLSRDDPFAGARTGAPPPGTATEPRVSVTPPTDRAAAIMETGNPDITIVWLYEREGT